MLLLITDIKYKYFDRDGKSRDQKVKVLPCFYSTYSKNSSVKITFL